MKQALIVIALVGCGAEHTEEIVDRVCYTEQERTIYAEAVVACIKSGNPMSDEEGEDLVLQCEISMERIVCPEHKVKVRRTGTGHELWRRVVL